MLKLLFGSLLGVGLYLFLSYYQPIVESTENTHQVEAAPALEHGDRYVITPLPPHDNVVDLGI